MHLFCLQVSKHFFLLTFENKATATCAAQFKAYTDDFSSLHTKLVTCTLKVRALFFFLIRKHIRVPVGDGTNNVLRGAANKQNAGQLEAPLC